MGLKDLFKSRETKEKEAAISQEASAEQELQKILNSPVELKNLCSILNSKDSMTMFNFCTRLQKGEKQSKMDKTPKASELVGTARWGSFAHITKARQKEAEIAQRFREVKALEAKALKGDMLARMTYPQRCQLMKAEMGTYTTYQNAYSICVLNLLQKAVLSGRIKDLSKLQDMIARTQVENNNRKMKLGLIPPTQPKAIQKAGKSR